MGIEKGTLLFLAASGMELSWLYAWANFLTTSILNRPFPLPDAILAFGLAALFTRLSWARGWRIIQMIGLQLIGLIFAASAVVYAFNSFPSSYWSKDWLVAFFNQQRSPLEWIALILILLWSLFFWIPGLALVRRPASYTRICSRFDLGLGAFFVLFLVKWIPAANEGIKIVDPVSELLLLPFFIFSLLAIGQARNRSDRPKDFLPGWRGIGTILTFTAVVLLFCTGLVLFFLPWLTLAANTGYVMLKIAGRPLVYLFLLIIRFMFARGITRPEEPSSPAGGTPEISSAPIENSWWEEILEKLLIWGFWGILGLAAIASFCVALFYLFRWLLSRTSKRQAKGLRWDLFSVWTEKLRAFAVLLWQYVRRKAHGYTRAGQLYAALLGWGSRSGLSRFASETPQEYGLRLRHHFPPLGPEITLIVEAFHQEVYGGVVLHKDQLTEARSAWRRLRSPLLWPSRLKTWCHIPPSAIPNPHSAMQLK